MDILDLLRSDGSIVVNKKLSHKIGLHEAVILSELIARFKWHQEKDKDKNGWFYCTHETLEKQTSLNRYYQDKAINNLLNLGLIDKKTTGVPAKRHFFINEKMIINAVTGQIVKDSQTRLSESNKQDCEIVTNKNVKDSQQVILNNNTKDNTKNNTSGGYKEKYPPIGKLDRNSAGHRKYPDKFEDLWKIYPDREGSAGKGGAYKKFRARIKEGISYEKLFNGVKTYMIEKKNERKIGSRYIMQMKKFFGPQDIWLEYAEKELRDKGGGNNGFQKNNGGKTKEVKKEHSKYDEGFVTG